MLNKIISFLIIATMISGFLVPCAQAEINDISSSQTEEAYDFSSILHSSELTKEILADDVVFMTSNNKCFINNEKHDYKEFSSSPFTDENKILYVPSDILSQAFDLEAESDGINIIFGGKYRLTSGSSECVGEAVNISLNADVVLKNGIFFIPIESFCRNVLGKYVYADDRGYLLVSDKVRNYKNEYKEIWEETDSIHRYMHYDRPDEEKVYADIKKTGLLREHPKLLATKQDFENLLSKIINDVEYTYIYKKFLTKCDDYLEQELTKYEKPDGLRLYGAIVSAAIMISDLGIAYQLSGEEKYANRAWQELENILSWDDWNCDNHFLDSSEAVPRITRGYDCIYDYLTDERKTLFINRFQKLYLDYAVGACTGESAFTLHDSRYTNSNWGAICGNGMLHAALCLIDAEDESSLLTRKCKFLLSQIIQSLEFPFGNIFPSGTTQEGFVYWEYYLTGLTSATDLLMRICGNDYSFLSSPAYDKCVDFGIYGQTSLGGWPYSATKMDLGVYFPMSMFLHAKITGNTEKMQTLEAFKKELGVEGSIAYLLWNGAKSDDYKINYPLDYYIPGEEMSIMKSSWNTKNGIHLATLGGENATTMTTFDKGTFLLEALGERWFVDLGYDNYNVTDGGSYWDIDVRRRLYRVRTEGHNCIVINPTPDTFGQEIDASAKIVRHESKDRGAISVYDLTDVYGTQTNGYKRGFYLCDNRNAVILQDELTLSQASELYWFLHTQADVTISSDGKSALFNQNGKKLRVELYTNLDNWQLEVTDAEPLSEATKVEGEYPRDGIRKLSLKSAHASGDVIICAKIIPVDDDISVKSLEYIPLDQWEIPDGEINKLKTTKKIIFKNNQTFDTMSDAYATQSMNNIDLSLISDFSKDFGWTLTGENVFLKRGTGKTGESGDYAVQIHPFGNDNNATAVFRLDNWTQKINSGTVYLEYDWAVTPVQNGTTPVMYGIPVPGYSALKLSDSDNIYDTDVIPTHGEWVHMRYEYDVYYNTCSLWINGVKYWDNRKCGNNPNNSLSGLVFQPCFYSGANYFTKLGAARFCLDNFNLYAVEEEEFDVINKYDIRLQNVDMIFEEGDNCSLSLKYENLTNSDINGKMIVAYYDETETMLLGVSTTDKTITSVGGTITKTVSIPEGAEMLKVMFWENTNEIRPLTNVFTTKVR